MRRLLPNEPHARPWSTARRLRGWVATWVQDRRRGRRPLMTVTAYDFVISWGMLKTLNVNLQVGRLALWKFVSFQLRYRLASQPGVWLDAGTKTNFNTTWLTWGTGPVTEGEDYVFELTVTETSGVVTVTQETVNVGYS